MREITKEELELTLEKHKLWLRGDLGGERADLSVADLSGARANAIMEFVKRIEPELANNTDISAVGYQAVIAIIDNLVKEMTEE